MIFAEDGRPLQGITGGFDDNRRVDFPLKPEMRKGVTLYAEISCNGMFGLPSDGSGDPDPNRFFILASADIVVKRPQAWRLMWDFDMLRGCVSEMPKDGVLQNKALWVCNEIMSTFRKGDLSSIDRCRKIAQEVLGSDWDSKGEKLYKDGSSSADPLLWSLGHTHIDTAWLWPFSATQQKIARSWSTQLDLMDRYPEYKFTASTAQQFAWLEELYPELFERVKAQVKAGRFLPIGGTWVENDANMPSGEAFVRQFLYGQRFFKSRFGKRCDIFWLPDSFGYNAQIPQLARGAGCQYWFTQKLSWSNINKFPHNTFMWVGLDGTQIITHMTPVDNYDSQCGVNDIRKGVWNNKNLNVQPAALHLYGFGDGGGGPTAPMLEKLRRARAIHNNGFSEMPKVTVGKTAADFYDHVLEITDGGERLPTWQGEIYLEFHRGVQTSHGSIKRWNRKLEILLHNVEWVATLASLHKAQYSYPKSELDELWEAVLKCQFHDVLPGSSIRLVYDDAERIYADVDRRAKALFQQASASLCGEQAGSNGLAINTLDLPRRELVRVPRDSVSQSSQSLAVQTSKADGSALLLVEDVNKSGALTLCPSPVTAMQDLEAVSVTEGANGDFQLRNASVSLKVADGRIVSIYDIIADRELIAPGRTAGLSICEDYPAQFDAWDTDIWSLDTLEEIKFERVRLQERGPWRATLALQATFGKSSANLKLSLDALSATQLTHPRTARSFVHVEADIDWQEKHRFLRFEVPTSLQTDSASFETQFGITKRPTSRNTSWEAAKFEVCGHKFADLSEANYGFAIINDCKYGHSAEGGTLRLSLLKAATYPDAHQDEGRHTFGFALYPHDKALAESDVVAAARLFNNPVEVTPGSAALSGAVRAGAATRRSGVMPFTLEQSRSKFGGRAPGTVVLDTMKRGEADSEYYGEKASGETTVVLRMYESVGAHADVVLRVDPDSSVFGVEGSRSIRKIVTCSILEDDEEEEGKEVGAAEEGKGTALHTWLDVADGSSLKTQLSFRPFEVRTVKLYLD